MPRGRGFLPRLSNPARRAGGVAIFVFPAIVSSLCLNLLAFTKSCLQHGSRVIPDRAEPEGDRQSVRKDLWLTRRAPPGFSVPLRAIPIPISIEGHEPGLRSISP